MLMSNIFDKIEDDIEYIICIISLLVFIFIIIFFGYINPPYNNALTCINTTTFSITNRVTLNHITTMINTTFSSITQTSTLWIGKC